ncbi:hypothetical protein ACOSP7_033041 [Xanthoceras sorbifolium]
MEIWRKTIKDDRSSSSRNRGGRGKVIKRVSKQESNTTPFKCSSGGVHHVECHPDFRRTILLGVAHH